MWHDKAYVIGSKPYRMQPPGSKTQELCVEAFDPLIYGWVPTNQVLPDYSDACAVVID